jgi:hypothetical protein
MKPTQEQVVEWARQSGDDWDHTLPQDREFLERFAALAFAAGQEAVSQTLSFDEWYAEHAKYMEPSDIVHWCRDAYAAGQASKVPKKIAPSYADIPAVAAYVTGWNECINAMLAAAPSQETGE